MRQAMIMCHHRHMDKSRPRVDVITIGDVVRASGVAIEQLPIEQFWEDLRRNGLMVRDNDGSHALTNYAVQAGELVVVGHGDTEDDRSSHDSGDRQDHSRDTHTGWDIDISID
jgi:hypothetical protein